MTTAVSSANVKSSAVITVLRLRQMNSALVQVDYDGEDGRRRLDPPPANADMDPDYMPLPNRTTQVVPGHLPPAGIVPMLPVCLCGWWGRGGGGGGSLECD